MESRIHREVYVRFGREGKQVLQGISRTLPHDVQLFLGCTDPLTAEFVSSRTGLASVTVSSQAKQLGTWRISNYTPEYRETSGVGKRPVLTPDEVLRLPIDKALIIIRGKKILKVDKMDYSKHVEFPKLQTCKASSHIPEWRRQEEEKAPEAKARRTAKSKEASAEPSASPEMKSAEPKKPPKRRAAAPASRSKSASKDTTPAVRPEREVITNASEETATKNDDMSGIITADKDSILS